VQGATRPERVLRRRCRSCRPALVYSSIRVVGCCCVRSIHKSMAPNDVARNSISIQQRGVPYHERVVPQSICRIASALTQACSLACYFRLLSRFVTPRVIRASCLFVFTTVPFLFAISSKLASALQRGDWIHCAPHIRHSTRFAICRAHNAFAGWLAALVSARPPYSVKHLLLPRDYCVLVRQQGHFRSAHRRHGRRSPQHILSNHSQSCDRATSAYQVDSMRSRWSKCHKWQSRSVKEP